MIQVDRDGYGLAHKVKTTKQARVDLIKAAQQLDALGMQESAKRLRELADKTHIDTDEEESD